MIHFRICSVLLSLLLFSTACQEEAPQENASTTPPKAIKVNQRKAVKSPAFATMIAEPSTMNRNLKVSGRLQPIEQLQIVAEVQGQALKTKKLLNEGMKYRKGELMIELDDAQYRFNLMAQKSQFQAGLVRIMSQIQLDYPAAHSAWDAYLRNFDAAKILPELPAVTNDQLRYFLSANNVYANYYNIKSTEELLPKYKIEAPFTGIITQGSVSPNSVISPGIPLANLSRTDVYELKAAVSTTDIDRFKVGQKLVLIQNNTQQKYTGTIHRIGGTIDPATQAIPAFIRVSGKGLREGMYLEANLSADSFAEAVELPIDALNRNNQVHLIQDSIIVLKDVEPVKFIQDRVWVQGLQTGDEVITEKMQQPMVGAKAFTQ